MSNNPEISKIVSRCASCKCHYLAGETCSSLDVMIDIVTDCSYWHGKEGFIRIKGQKIITDPYAYLHNYPDTIISFHQNGIYINKNVTKLLDHCKNNLPPIMMLPMSRTRI